MESILHQFLHSHTHTKKSDDITHMSFGLDGILKLKVPFEGNELEDFYAIYLDYVKSLSYEQCLQGLNVIVERVPKESTFNFFIDIDAPQGDDAQDILDKIIDYITRVSTITKDEVAVSKRLINKIHIVFPGLEVKTNQAKSIRDMIVHHISNESTEDLIIYDKIVDRSVYSSGLRMLFSHKGKMAKLGVQDNNADSQLYVPLHINSVEDVTLDMFLKHSILWKHTHKHSFEPSFLKKIEGQSLLGKRSRSKIVPGKREDDNQLSSQIHLTDNEVDMLKYYLKNVFKLDGVSFENDQKIRCLQDPVAIEVTLDNQACPFTKTDSEPARFHARTCTRNVPTNYILITASGVFFKCWNSECSGKSVKLCSSDFIFDGFFSRNDEWYYLKKSLSLTHETVGNFVFHHYAKNNYRVVRAGKSFNWYFWGQGRWTEADNIAAEIMDQQGAIQSQYTTWLAMQMASERDQITDDDDNGETGEKDKKKSDTAVISKVLKLLQTRTFVEHIKQTVAAKLLQYDPAFESKLDQQPALVCFENGVLDFGSDVTSKKVQFRAGKPEDCCSISTGNNYYSWDAIPETTKAELNKFLTEIFPDENVREYTLWVLASCLNGNIKKQKFYFMLGSGANGKSSLMKLMSLSLGPYSVDVSVSLVTKERTQSSAPTPDLITLKHSKWITMSEPDAGDSIRVGLIKQLSSSNDKITGRQLYGAPQSFYIYGTTAILCNEIPQISATSPNDFGSWRRLTVLPFESTFTDKPIKGKSHQYKVDFTIDGKLDSWKAAFLALLVTKLEKYGASGPEVPEKVEKLTKDLRWRSNYVGRFREEMLEESTTFSSIRTLWKEFVTYSKYSLHITEKQRGSIDSFRQQIIALLGEVQKHENEEGFFIKAKSCF